MGILIRFPPPQSVQAVSGSLPSSSIEYLLVLQDLLPLPPDPGGARPAHHRQLPVYGGHGVAPPAAVEAGQGDLTLQLSTFLSSMKIILNFLNCSLCSKKKNSINTVNL